MMAIESKGEMSMRGWKFQFQAGRLRNFNKMSTSMGIALTLLAGGLVTQITDALQLFGRNSVVPLLIGLAVIFIGVTFFVVRHRLAKR